MDKRIEMPSETHEDSGALDASNSRTPPIDLKKKMVKLDNEWFYDMTGEKILIILNQRKFMRTRYFRCKPTFRKGTNKDRDELEKVFKQLGFKVIVLHNHQYHNIIQKLTAIAASDHTRTSCISVAILTHGGRGGQILAADRPYLLSEIMDIFANEPSLVGKPKTYFVQACRGKKRDAGQTVHLGRLGDGGRAKNLPPHTSPSQDITETDSDETDRFHVQSKNVLTVPSHADSLVLYACAEDYISHRNADGSWMIQSLCRQIEDLHEFEDILGIITRVHAEVSGKTSSSSLAEKNNKKQMPQTFFNLRKKLKF